MFRKTLIVTSGPEGAKRAFAVALDLAARFDSKLEAISIIERMPQYATTISEAKMMEDREREHFEEIHRSAQLEAAKRGVESRSKIAPGHEVKTPVPYSRREGFDLLVIGRQGHSAQET